MPGSDYSEKSLSIMLFVGASIWGLFWVPLRALENLGLGDGWGVAYMNFCPLIVLLPYIFWRHKRTLHNMRAVALAGTLTGVAIAFYATGLVVSSVVRVTMLFYLVPVWSTFIGVFWLSESLTRSRVIAIALGLSGVFLLLAGNDATAIPLNIGDLLALLSGMFWALGGACIKRWPQVPTVTLSAFQFAVTVLTSVLLGLFVFTGHVPDARGDCRLSACFCDLYCSFAANGAGAILDIKAPVSGACWLADDVRSACRNP